MWTQGGCKFGRKNKGKIVAMALQPENNLL